MLWPSAVQIYQKPESGLAQQHRFNRRSFARGAFLGEHSDRCAQRLRRLWIRFCCSGGTSFSGKTACLCRRRVRCHQTGCLCKRIRTGEPPKSRIAIIAFDSLAKAQAPIRRANTAKAERSATNVGVPALGRGGCGAIIEPNVSSCSLHTIIDSSCWRMEPNASRFGSRPFHPAAEFLFTFSLVCPGVIFEACLSDLLRWRNNLTN
jgi:hypothetical protein